MVLHQLLTVLDAVTAFVLATHVALGWFSTEIVVYHASYVILKGIIFLVKDWASRIDVVVGIYMILVTFNVISLGVLTAMSVAWLLQKSIFTFIVPLLKIFSD
ncbi:MAG: hypothetical protein HYW23_02765 [Candidatus Aenigmarchaeota archaeon]|nr:hypothetical protein [Candidatus Aenigmarchaeota archaeon]